MGAVFTNQATASIGYHGDGARTDFPFGFDVFDVGDVQVSVNGAVVTTGFHIALATHDDAIGGTVRFETPPVLGAEIILARMLKLRRLSAYGSVGSPRGDALDRDLDYLTAALGDVDRALAGTLRLGAPDLDQANMTLPAMDAGRALIWNDAGNGLSNGPKADEIAGAGQNAALAKGAASRAEAAQSRCETAQKAFGQHDAGAMIDLDFRSQNLLGWEDERRMPVIDAPTNRIMDIRETGSLVRLSNGARATLPVATLARNGVRYRLFNGDGTQVDIMAASGDVITPVNGAADAMLYPLPIRGDMVDVICDGGRWFAAPVRENGPIVKLLRTAAQDMPAGGAFLIEWDQVTEDSHSLYDSAVHGVSSLPPGFYHVDIGVKFPVTDEVVMVNLYLERLAGAGAGVWTTHMQSSDITAIGTGAYHTLRLSGVARIDVGAANGLRVRLAHSDAATRQIGESNILTWFHLHRIGG
ncbi:hypothetical protein [Thalassospira lohafexi]|uniref:Uncharacterized protein n=1 Tax=Thalassospira lohafexi TaxID=744227 RepID=A0A2N3L6C8_9PROT|nr:hypothetical protein [Thalassospira lohafexi]PKR58413.1 hypothetical protein COO92_11795 [Thalassospira lohafexi]